MNEKPDARDATAIWLDCDPGHDDAMAIILAGHHPAVHLLGISTVAGNQTLDKVTTNALSVLHASGINADVVKGQDKPLMRPRPLLCPEIHGETGLDGPSGACLPDPPTRAVPGKAVNIMFERIQQHYKATGRRVVVCCTGALTNAALLLVVYPEIMSSIEFVLMGGCLGLGNTGPVMEFNIQTDPEAAKVVFESGVAVTMVPLEVTHTALVTPDVVARIVGLRGSPYRHLIRLLLMFFSDTYREVFKFDAPPLHDPCAVAYIIAPHIFKVDHMRVDIETCSTLSAGQTVCDIWQQTGRPKNAFVATSMDVAAFWDLMIAAIEAADKVSPINKDGSSLDAQ